MNIKAPYLPYDRLRTISESFLAEHNSPMALPVPIEDIVEFRLHMDVIHEPGLHSTFQIDSFLSADCTEIRVDENVWQRYPERYRFSLAHEVSHSIIHRDIIASLRADTITEWKTAIASIPEEEYSFLEWQAYCLAGLILVPAGPLKSEFQSLASRARAAGVDLADTSDTSRKIIESNLARSFAVSRPVITKRMSYDKLW